MKDCITALKNARCSAGYNTSEIVILKVLAVCDYMDNTPDHSPVPWPEKSKFDISQLDYIFSLYDLPPSNSEEDKNEILPNSFLKSMNVDRPLSLNRLFEDEDLYLGDSSLAGLDSHTLPSLFRVSGKKHQKAKNADRSFNEKRLRELLWSEEKLNGMSLCLCEFAELIAESSLTLPEHSPLASLVPSGRKCSLAHILKEVLRFALRNIHEAIVQETNSAPQTKVSLEKNVPIPVSYTHLTLPTNREV
eukprot:TRINITY_DN13939_c0_g2_i9.p1 TRINITY_DN13939_c0_g2~~TRINITY_DN13939_c0_g2_i9.p1  ORF type:complete len:248 (-),score=37.09 TRINITY_DN13939_c0_g2_i9:45-788(-)